MGLRDFVGCNERSLRHRSLRKKSICPSAPQTTAEEKVYTEEAISAEVRVEVSVEDAPFVDENLAPSHGDVLAEAIVAAISVSKQIRTPN